MSDEITTDILDESINTLKDYLSILEQIQQDKGIFHQAIVMYKTESTYFTNIAEVYRLIVKLNKRFSTLRSMLIYISLYKRDGDDIKRHIQKQGTGVVQTTDYRNEGGMV